MKLIQTLGVALITVALTFGMGVLMVDALEYETTGTCKECVALSRMKPSLITGTAGN